MIRTYSILALFLAALLPTGRALPQDVPDLRAGLALHAFDHLGNLGCQAAAAAACGVTVLYATGLGQDGYHGLPPPGQWQGHLKDCEEYTERARRLGIPTVIGYLCATSIVGLDTFDKNWTPEQRAEFGSSPGSWLQQDAKGQSLPSWYGGDYRPACMNNPHWRAYEKFMVRAQIVTGHAGIFFDNPTVHPNGCYCPHCMARFAEFLQVEGRDVPDKSVDALRGLALNEPRNFKRFRCTIARDFIEEMRTFARSVNPNAVITVNNSLNTPGVLFAQCHLYAYNIHEMSKTEDFVVIEDMGSQPRILPDGKTMEYGPTYAQVQAIIHGKPLVAVTIADADYHTAPDLVRLAMTEAAAHRAAYMLWATWPEDVRPRMIARIRPCVDWLRANAGLLDHTKPRRDVAVYLPFRRWADSEKCVVSDLAARLTQANIPYVVFDEDAFSQEQLRGTRVLLLENRSVLTDGEATIANAFTAAGGTVVAADSSEWLADVLPVLKELSLALDAPKTVRAVVGDRDGATTVWLYNLNIARLSSYEDRVIPAEDLGVSVRVPFKEIASVTSSTADEAGTAGPLKFDTAAREDGMHVHIALPRLDIAAIITIQGK